MTGNRITLLRNQFNLTWQLAEVHLSALTDDDLLWKPASRHWTVRQDEDGIWRPDWELTEDGSEPDPVPAPTAGWISWHLGWWWSTTIDYLENLVPRDRTQVSWPGTADATVAWLRGIRDEWLRLLDDIDNSTLDAQTSFPWQAGTGYTVADTLAWANAELMKNVTEIGQLRLIRAAEPERSDATLPAAKTQGVGRPRAVCQCEVTADGDGYH